MEKDNTESEKAESASSLPQVDPVVDTVRQGQHRLAHQENDKVEDNQEQEGQHSQEAGMTDEENDKNATFWKSVIIK